MATKSIAAPGLIVTAFLKAGGRLMLDLKGRLEIHFDMGRVFGPQGTQENYNIVGRMIEALRSHRAAIRRMVRRTGMPAEGWVILAGEPA